MAIQNGKQIKSIETLTVVFLPATGVAVGFIFAKFLTVLAQWWQGGWDNTFTQYHDDKLTSATQKTFMAAPVIEWGDKGWLFWIISFVLTTFVFVLYRYATRRRRNYNDAMMVLPGP